MTTRQQEELGKLKALLESGAIGHAEFGELVALVPWRRNGICKYHTHSSQVRPKQIKE